MTLLNVERPAMDPFVFEIVRHKLFRVTDEAAIALENVSGTTITTEGHDLMVSLYRADGGLMVGGSGFLQHITCASQAVKHLMSRYGQNPGLNENDIYLFNDPYTGALHAPDVYLLAPVHWQGRLAGFIADFVHITDVGGIDPGGFCPRARSSYEEGFASQGIKLVDAGKLRTDVFETILNVVRDPGMVGLDLKSLLAATHVARERLLELYAEYGFETVDDVSARLIEQSEALFRQRLRELPDGSWRARTYYERPDSPLRIELLATKADDTLTFDFSGTDGQVDYGINCSYWATWGSVFASLFPVLTHDLVWNDGILAPVTLIAPEGSLVNARRPAPVSMATVAIVQTVRNLTMQVIAKMMGASQKHHQRATATWAPTNMAYFLAGQAKGGQWVVHGGTDTFAGSGGATAVRDGLDLGGQPHALMSRWANAERHEASFPHMYLFRRLVPDSGGPGKYRGGVCHEYAVRPHEAVDNRFTAVLQPGRGMEASLSHGLFGGYPGCNTEVIEFRHTNPGQIPASRDGITSAAQDRIGLGVTDISDSDILYVRYDGAGGYGDPLERDSEAVAADVENGLVTRGPARDVYGVVLHADGSVDLVATHHQRVRLREQRLGGTSLDPRLFARQPVKRTQRRIGEYLQVAGSPDAEFVQCTWCGASLCERDEPWKDHAVVRESPASIAGPNRVTTMRYVLYEYFCPGCATALEVDNAFAGDPPLHDVIRRWIDEPRRPPEVADTIG